MKVSKVRLINISLAEGKLFFIIKMYGKNFVQNSPTSPSLKTSRNFVYSNLLMPGR